MANIEILIREKNENWPHDVYWCQKQKFTGGEKHLRMADKRSFSQICSSTGMTENPIWLGPNGSFGIHWGAVNKGWWEGIFPGKNFGSYLFVKKSWFLNLSVHTSSHNCIHSNVGSNIWGRRLELSYQGFCNANLRSESNVWAYPGEWHPYTSWADVPQCSQCGPPIHPAFGRDNICSIKTNSVS